MNSEWSIGNLIGNVQLTGNPFQLLVFLTVADGVGRLTEVNSGITSDTTLISGTLAEVVIELGFGMRDRSWSVIFQDVSTT